MTQFRLILCLTIPHLSFLLHEIYCFGDEKWDGFNGISITIFKEFNSSSQYFRLHPCASIVLEALYFIYESIFLPFLLLKDREKSNFHKGTQQLVSARGRKSCNFMWIMKWRWGGKLGGFYIGHFNLTATTWKL